MSWLVSNVSQMPSEEVAQLPTSKSSRRTCAGDCGHVLYNSDHGGDVHKVQSRWGGPVFRMGDGDRVLFHERCLPGQSPRQKIMNGIRATVEGSFSWMKRHPIITVTALGTLAAAGAYASLSKETFQTICFEDSVDNTVAWCANVASSMDPKSAVFEEYTRVNDWVHSGELTTKAYESVSGGTKFVYDTFTKYFVNDPLKPAKDWFQSLIS